ncbi:apolipoprotein B-100, partial [Caerostris darwini]
MCNLKVSCCLLLLFAGYSNTQNCPATDNENVLQPGYDYIYRFESKVVAEAVGTTDDKSPPGSESAWIEDQPLSDLSKYPVLFSLSNGEITEIQVDENDPIHFVNIKRGALSAFVFKLSYTTQPSKEMHTDVHGTCPWSSYPLLGSKGSVKAEKDMLHCSFPSRKDWQFSPYSLFWNMSFIQYVINSTTSCNYDININEKILNKVYCKERHAIMLESSSKTDVAVQSNIQYRMNFVSSSPQTEKKDLPDLSRKTDISYEFERTPNPDENPEDFLPVAKKMLSDLVEQSMDEISLSTIPQFTNFVAWIRSAKDLSSFIEEVKSCSFLTTACTPHMKDLGMSYLKDALIQCNSLPCIQAVSHLVESKDISGEYLNYFSWSNMHFSKPEILKFIMNICHATDSDVCWASLGSLFRRIYSSNQKLIEDSNIMHDVAKYFHDNIGRLCMSNDSNSETYPLLLRYLKTVRNMGRSYLLLIPQGIWRLTECVLKSDVPEYVRTFALETLQAVNPCHYEGHCETIYYQRMHILRNASESTTLRSLAYEHIIQIPQKYGFEDDILEILKTDENLQLKSYIANSLKSLLKDSYFRKKEEKFVKSMNQLLNDNELSLNKIIHYPGAKSASHVNSQYFSLSFLPDGLKEFGFKTINSNIYESSDVLPRYFNKELTIKAFSKFIDVFQLGGYSEGLEKVAIVFQKLVKDFNSDIPSFKKILNALQEALKEFKPTQEDSSQEYNFHESIIENIRKLEQIYRKFKPNPESFFTVFSDLFGTTAGYFSAKETIPSLSKLLEMHTLMNDLERGVTYNTTRVIRFIEAYHQVPTMMGLPLNWTSNATLAFSLRSGFNLKWDANGVKSGGFCHPSAALTFLNRMVIDFPTITQIGVQANSSGYTSTQWKANLEYSKDKKIFSFVKPTKTQKVLELFRTNQLIKHDRYQDIEDWDLERTSSSSCTNDEWSSALGLRACVSKSYPNVTRRLKPWALLSGWCKWQFFINSFDEKLESYDLEKIESTEAKSKDLIIKFSTSGSEDKREIFVKFEADDTKGERKALVEMPTYPDFIISYLQKKPLENSKERKRYTEVLILKLRKDHEYQLIYNEEDRLDNRLGNVAADESPTDKKPAALVHEQVLSLDTPYNSYRLSKEDSKNEEDTKMKVFFSYDNRNPSKKWLDTILPPSFWETEGKAWLLFQINWKEPKVFTDTTTRQTVCFVKDPHAIIYLDANSFEMTGREQTNINLTKTEINTGKLLGFANFTYDFWMSRNDEHKVTRDFNLTVGPKSWTVQMQNVIVGNKLAFEVTMKRSIIQTKSNEVLDYEDLWNKDTRSAFKEEKRQIKFIFDAEFVPMSSEELTDKYSKVKMDDIGGLSNYLVTGAFKFYYPFDNGEESVILDGYAIFSSGSTTFRFQKNIVLENSYSNLRITSDTVYSSIDDLYSLMHKTSLMYVPTEAEAILFIKGWLSTTCDKCMEGELVHNFNSKFFDYQSNVSYKCISDRKDMHILLLHFVQNSSAWNMLNYEIDQIVEDISPEYKYETTNFTHPALIINVTADWTRKIGDHKKRVLFTCTEENCQSTELLLEFLHDGKVSMKLIMPNDQNRIFLIEKTVSSNAKNLNIRINYSDDLEDESKDLQLKAEILSTDYHIWNLKLNLDTFYRVKHLFGNAYQKVLRNLLSITKDPQHPVNVMLEPTLKMPVYDYVQNVRIEVDDFIYTTWEGFKETLIILKPFYIAPLTIMKNTATNAETIARKICKELEERSVL